MADDVRILPTEWVGSWAGASWGVVTAHHPKHASHGESDPEWHAYSGDISFRIVQQERRSLEVLWISNGHESRGVGALSSNGRRLIITTQEMTIHLTVDGNSIEGESFGRAHGSGRRNDTFAVSVIELTAAP